MYPIEELDDDYDNGTMPGNVADLEAAVIGRRIVKAEKTSDYVTVITLDDGTAVELHDSSDCCAFTTLNKFLLHPERVDHVIAGVGTTNDFTNWHIFADYGDILELEVGWSAGNPFYYGYGFDIHVKKIEE
jgi:hypothetical protein